VVVSGTRTCKFSNSLSSRSPNSKCYQFCLTDVADDVNLEPYDGSPARRKGNTMVTVIHRHSHDGPDSRQKCPSAGTFRLTVMLTVTCPLLRLSPSIEHATRTSTSAPAGRERASDAFRAGTQSK
jgi:hypothetical protein